jgi:RND family efflux transporter MFP subunit
VDVIYKRILAIFLIFALVSGCQDKEQPQATKEDGQVTLITTTQPSLQSLDVVEETVGTIESQIEPWVAAEVAGRVEKIHVRPGETVKPGQILATLDAKDLLLGEQSDKAEVKRIQSLLDYQKKTIQRYKDLKKKQYISQDAYEGIVSQMKALEQQLLSAKSKLTLTEQSIAKTRIIARASARVESQLVSEGDYVNVGAPVFQIVDLKALRAHLPFPESTAALLRPGLRVTLTSPIAPDQPLEGTIKEINPMVGATNRSLNAIVEIDNHGAWKPGSSVNATVYFSQKNNVLTVPEQSIVLRPIGKVVYVIQNGNAYQKVVQTGVAQKGMIEVTQGLSSNEVIALEGAGFLSDATKVKVAPKI